MGAVIRAENLSKSFKGSKAVCNVSFNVNEGHIHALIGPNGAGKTTVFNLITKFLTPDAGDIFFRDTRITHQPAVQVAKLGLVRSFQISAVFASLSVRDNLALALQRTQGFVPFWRSTACWRAMDDRIEALALGVGLSHLLERTAGSLPYGRRRALELATTIAVAPEVLLLDEPMAGMGHEDINQMSALIREAARGRTVLMVEHNLSVVESLCDRITVLQRGEIISEGTYAHVSANPLVRSAYMGVEE